MNVRELTCINCPLGCSLTVTLDGEKVIKVEGNTCPKGKTYGEKEVINPTRILTSSVMVTDGKLPVVSVKTASDIPKNKITDMHNVKNTPNVVTLSKITPPTVAPITPITIFQI